MSYETFVKRTIWVSTCPKCGDKDIRDDNPPKERMHCGEWAPFKEESYTGPHLTK